MELTGQQRRIVEARGPEILAVAGAGTGKTHTLVARYLDLLRDHAPSEIVAVTFTEAAATEMRERVRREVSRQPGMAEPLRALDEAPIGTIQALCFRILIEHAAEAGIDPASRILGEDEAEYEALMACVDTLEEASADEALSLPILELSDEGGPERVTDLLADLVRSRDDARAAFAKMSGAGEPTATRRERTGGWAAPPPTVEQFLAFARAACDRAVEQLLAEQGIRLDELAAELAAMECKDPSDKLFEPWNEARETLSTMPDEPHARRDHLRRAGAGSWRLSGGRQANWPDHTPQEVRDLLREIKTIIEALETVGWNKHDERAVPATLALRELFEEACDIYEARKRALSALDYLDLEVRARDLLAGSPEVAPALQRRYRHILVDEFQDTNPTQVEIIDLLAGSRQEPPSVHRFYLGDAKQAIYRFRGGDVRGFRRAEARLRDEEGRVLPLVESFRTHDGLVGVVNDVFKRVLAGTGEEYEAEMEPLEGRAGEPPPGPHVTVVTFRKPADGAKTNADQKTRFEALLVAREIRKLLYEEREVWDREAGMRPVRPSDIAILLRRFTKVREFEEALALAGVPYRTASGEGFFTRAEIVDLTNLLAWLAEPDDDLALIGVLRSPLFLIDDPTLFRLREERRPLVPALRDPPESVEEAARSTCGRAADVLAGLAQLAAAESVDAVLTRALALTGFEAVWAALPGGEQAVANIAKFVAMAQSLRARSIDEFLTYLVRRRDELTAREGQAVFDDADAVRLLTVHRSKGLEFPVVFVAEAHMTNRRQDERLLVSRERGVSMSLPRDEEASAGGDSERKRLYPGFYRAIQRGENDEDGAEFRRLFYVAATRAGDHLYLSGEHSEKDDRDAWLSWAMPVLATIGDGRVEIRPPAPLDFEAIQRQGPKPAAIPAAETEVDYVAPLLARPPVIPVRTSTPVTSILPEADHPWSGHGDGLAAFRGTVAHRAVELTYGAKACPPLPELIAQLRDRPLAREDAERVAAEVEGYLERFAASELGRLLAAGEIEARYEVPF
ncbi:MAG: UvrD-helicase domain-containing protein, partial [Dehalococcoidia bacterium]